MLTSSAISAEAWSAGTTQARYCRAALPHTCRTFFGTRSAVLNSKKVHPHARVTVVIFVMPSRRLEDRIRDLCAKAATASDAETVRVLQELRQALHEHARHLRAMAADKLTAGTQRSGADGRRKQSRLLREE